MKRYFDKANKRLVYVGEAANDAYWDRHWLSQSPRSYRQPRNRGGGLVVGNTRKYLPAGARILEGGCGQATNVHALHYSGYDTYGVDFAKKTVEAVNKCAPELKVTLGDVRNLPFEDGFFDGYWSLGVIEHFYEGYDPVLSEAYRVLTDNGHLFVTVPVMSVLRKHKARLSMYAEYEESQQTRNCFYQFAFDHRCVIEDLESKGFKLVDFKRWGGVKGLKDEVSLLKPCLQYMYDKNSRCANLTKKMLNLFLNAFTNHMGLFIVRKAGTG